MRDVGKGDKKRPVLNQEQFDKSWDEIFNKDKKIPPSDLEVKIDIASDEKRVIVNKTWTF